MELRRTPYRIIDPQAPFKTRPVLPSASTHTQVQEPIEDLLRKTFLIELELELDVTRPELNLPGRYMPYVAICVF